MKVELTKYKLNELLARGDSRANDDEFVQYGDPKKIAVFAANPFRHDEDPETRVVLRADGVIAGGEYAYPVEVIADNEIVKCGSGSETSVKEEFRKSAVGLEFLASEGDISESSAISLGCGMAQRYARIHKMFGYKIFPMRRHIALFKSRSVVEMRLKGIVGKMVSRLVDWLLSLYWVLDGIVNRFRLRGVSIVEIGSDDIEGLTQVAQLIAADAHRFREHHPVEWLQWHLKYALHPEGPARLFGLKRNDQMVAFFMTKRKFFAQASSRGFKNVMLGSVIEWGVAPDQAIKEFGVVMAAVRKLRSSSVDAVEVATADAVLSRCLRHHLLIPVGESNFGIRVGGRSRLAETNGWDNPDNWRLRPAMCDNGL